MAFARGQTWPNATIPYEIDSNDFPVDSPERNAIDRAISEWNDNTVIRLVHHSTENDFFVFEDIDDPSRQCDSKVGRVGGRQSLNCDLEGGVFAAGNLMHELGHTVGFLHEHQRPDRVNFVQVGSSNNANCALVQNGRLLTDYDCDSIMHYPSGTVTCGDIVPMVSGCSKIGQREHLSGRDVWGASLLYGIPMHSIVVWEDDSAAQGSFDVHASGQSQKGQRCCGPLPINRFVGNQQRTPEVGMDGDRNMVYVWADDRDGNGFFEIKMRGFGANGRQLFSQRKVNVRGNGQQIAPDVAVAHDGRFVVVWQDDTDKNNVHQIKMRGFNRDGSERFSQRTVNIRARGQQTAPRVAIAPDGIFVVIWEDDPDKNGFNNIRMRGFHANGTERWGERQVNVRSSGQQRRPQIAMGPFGDFVVVWEDDADKNTSFQIRMRAFTADGNEKFSERTVNSRAAGQQFDPDVAVDDVFRPVVVWADDADKNRRFQIRMRGFESDGRQRLAEQVVNTDRDGQQCRPSIGMGASGQFTIAWENDADKDGRADILVRGFNTDGTERFTTQHVSNKELKGKEGREDGQRARPRVAMPAMAWFDPFNPIP